MLGYSDNYSTNPELNFLVYAQEIARIAVEATSGDTGAFAVGIFGTWGSGKTTLMKRIEHELNQLSSSNSHEINCKTIWFNSWKYDKKESVWNALIQTILLKIKAEKTLPEIQEKIDKLSRSLFLHSLGLITELAKQVVLSILKNKAGVDLKDIEPVDIWSKDVLLSQNLTEYYSTVNRFEEDFKDVVESYVGRKGRLVVFIDDLDRCLPENALAVLEALKLYLDQSNCTFFIGIDKRTIEQAVSQRYKDIPITGREYLEKMIQLHFFLPEKAPDDVRSYLINNLNALAAPTIVHNELWDAILEATGSNLRKTKQFIVSWSLVRSLAKELYVEEKETKKLAVLLLIQMFYSNLYDVVARRDHFIIQMLLKASANEDQRSELVKLHYKYEAFLKDDNLLRFLKHCGPILIDMDNLDSLEKLLCILPQVGRNAN